MKKKTVVSMVASSLLLAPFVLNQVVAADEKYLGDDGEIQKWLTKEKLMFVVLEKYDIHLTLQE